MSYNLGTARGDIRIEYDDRGVARARDSLGRFVSLSSLAGEAMDENDKKSKKTARSFDLLGKAIFKTTKYITLTASAIQTLITTTNILIAVVQALLPIIGATLATLPGIIFAAISALVVLKAAFNGVGEALKAAFSGDADKLAEALKKLAPSAREFVLAVQDATKKLHPLQQAIQQAFFSGLGKQLPAVVASLNQLQGTSTRLATAFNGLVSQLFAFASTPAFVLSVQEAMLGLANLLNILAPAILPILTGLAGMARNAAALAEQVKGNLLPAATELGTRLSKFDIAGAFKKGFDALQPLITIFRDLGTIIHTVFTDMSAFSSSGQQVLGTVGSILDAVAKFVQTDAATKAFSALGEAFSAIAGVVGDVLLQALAAVAPVVTALAPLFTVLARVLGNLLTSAIQILAPILLQLATALDGALGSILPGIAEAVQSVVTALGPLLALIASQLSPLLIALAPIIEQAAKTIAVQLVLAIQQLMPVLADLLPAIVNIVTQVGPSLVELLAAFAKGFAAAAPFMLIMAQIVVGVLVPALNLMAPILSVVIGVIATLVGWLATLIGWIGSWVGSWLQATKISDFIQKVISVIINILTGGAVQIGNISRAAVASMTSAFSQVASIAGTVSNAFTSIKNSVSNAISNAISTVRAFPGQIAGALGNLGGLLYGAGQDLIQGFVNGIRSMAGRAAEAAKAAVAGIPGQIKGLLGIASPSKVTAALGEEVSRGLAVGILRTMDLVQKAAATAAGQVVVGLPTDFSSSVSSAVTASIGASSGVVAPTAGGAGSPAVVAGGTVINQTVNAIPGMNAKQVGDYAITRLGLALNTRAVAA